MKKIDPVAGMERAAIAEPKRINRSIYLSPSAENAMARIMVDEQTTNISRLISDLLVAEDARRRA